MLSGQSVIILIGNRFVKIIDLSEANCCFLVWVRIVVDLKI